MIIYLLSLLSSSALHQTAVPPPIVPPPNLRVVPPPITNEPQRTETPAERKSDRLFFQLSQGNAEQSAAAATEVEAHPDSIQPMGLIFLTMYLLKRGDMERAAFWYYFWQVRVLPWAQLGSPDGDGALRASFTYMVGPMINDWAGSDPIATRDLILQAWSWERRVPLYPVRPEGVSEDAWQKAVAAARAEDDPERLRREFRVDSTSLAAIAESRRKNGLFVGPWQHRGRPVPDQWR